ncbi:hypothetical protein LTR81_012424 [Elasticomyces elasticus]
MGSAENQHALQCAVVGAGIAGLGAAIALRRAGHDVEIFEKSTLKREIGAAITLTPNGNLVLDRWGFDAKRARQTMKEQYRVLNHQTLEVVERDSFENVAKEYGHSFDAYHRVDMHEEIRRLAEQAGAVLRLGSQAVDVDCEKGVITFDDGSVVTKDLVVIADGIKSRFVDVVSGEHVPTQKTGKSVYRTLIPFDRIMKDPLIAPIFDQQKSGFCSFINRESHMFFVTYPCRNDEVCNLAIFHDTKPHQANKEHWNSPATVDDALELLDGCHPAWPALVRHADSMNCYVVGRRDVIPRMTNGKVVLIGDAAHPMQPTHAQGGSMSLEDAAAFEVLFSNWSTEDSIEKRLALFNQLRLPRNVVTQLCSNAMFYMIASGDVDEGDAFMAALRRYWDGPLLPLSSKSWSKPIRDFFYGYDAFAEAEKALKYKDEPNGLPEGVIKHFGVSKGP